MFWYYPNNLKSSQNISYYTQKHIAFLEASFVQKEKKAEI